MGKYIKQLTQQDIENFLKQNNYTPCHTLKDDDGKPLPAISRHDDMIFMRCQRIFAENEQEIDKQVAYELYKKFRGFIALSMLNRYGDISTEIDLIVLSDFDLTLIAEDIFISPEKSDLLFENYINFMIEKFANQNYKNELLNHYEISTENITSLGE